ncbi:cupin domain-containing protein [Promicromonospora sp. NPDC019610]|uniref:cupin domain-containing protein n=1 Tax=Promicromonospora sp. NPDC019610 TaxID=3364405 RepID=UPI003796A7D8
MPHRYRSDDDSPSDARTPSGLPRTVASDAMGVSVTFLRSAEESSDASVETEVVLKAGGQGPPLHMHTGFEETFTTAQGVLWFDIGEQRAVQLSARQSVVVPIGLAHRYYNGGDQPVVFRFVARPGAAYERSIRAGFGREAAGRANRFGLPRNLLEAALVIEESDSFVVGMPLGLQRILVRLGAWFARRLGVQHRFDPYLTPQPDTHAEPVSGSNP